MKIAIVGAGAIGTSIGATLKKNGADVEFIVLTKKEKEISETTGTRVSGVKGDFTVVVPAKLSLAELTEKKDVIIISTKAYNLGDLAKTALSHITENGLIVSMQNGICAEIMEKNVGVKKTVMSAITFGATLHNLMDSEITSDGGFILGMLDGSKPKQLCDLAELLNNSFETNIADNILAELYTKLIINSCITAIGAICGLKLGEMMNQSYIRKIFISIVAESVNVANAMKLSLPPFGDKLNYYKFLSGKGFLGNIKRNIMLKIVGSKYRNLKSSSLQSLEKGEPTEIDFFAGYILRKGDEFNIDTPVNDKIYAMVKEIENGKRTISIENLNELK